jgi:hypothetical protein
MANHVKIPLLIQHFIEVYPLEIRAVDGGWEISCPPGPLAEFLLSAAPQATIKQRGPYVIVQFSAELDREILRMIQALIDLRYRTGQVQLELWGDL